ncbi:MAG: UDP-N-acetylmuramoyl-L-alanyl-D-glutamate--2,6-diaminopimelate ligase [Candidatus Eisenbacteria bacterium]|nr:UDP-N-acetylmuramoyl-L-alanyl-D-glutamate--2,6-diaminopimelate ligase [Candidatus Eisenbacteria bacterium]
MMTVENQAMRFDLLLEEAALPVKERVGDCAVPVRRITADSRAAGPESLFVALRGFRTDGHRFLREAAERGASAALVEQPNRAVRIPQAVVPDTRIALGEAADRLYGRPSRAIPVFGVTGTNGKTTVIHLLASILRSAGGRCGLLGTLGYKWDGESLEAPNTTPGPDVIHGLLARMRADGIDRVAMEVSSHAVSLKRVSGLKLQALALTNVTRDHLDFHRSEERYREAKRRLFFPELAGEDRVEVGAAVLNRDDPVGAELAAESPLPRITYSVGGDADLRGEILASEPEGLRLRLRYEGEEAETRLPMAGAFNAANALAAAGLALTAGVRLAEAAAGLAWAAPPPGRMERVAGDQDFTVIIDYAHTPDGFRQLLPAVRAFTVARLIVVFGCGGERDEGKRAIMGEIAGAGANLVVLTDDNPRGEDPAKIRAQVEEGLRKAGAIYQVIPDRREAIAHAFRVAAPGDTVVLAGKGHERYQIIGREKFSWDERATAEELLAEGGGGS